MPAIAILLYQYGHCSENKMTFAVSVAARIIGFIKRILSPYWVSV